ncbi:MON1A (predicted), partial [Pycnogonum litorale]
LGHFSNGGGEMAECNNDIDVKNSTKSAGASDNELCEENGKIVEQNTLLLAVDSYEEITEEIESEFKDLKIRQRSGTISEIEKITTPEKESSPCFPSSNEIVTETLDDVSTEDTELESYEEEELREELSWQQRDKHIFILSEAGKPIYSRFGNEDKLVTIMGVMQALVSVVMDTKDTIRSMSTGEGGHLFVFLVRSPVILVGISRCGESETQLIIQLTYIYNQNLVFAILIADGQLVTLVRMKKYFLHPADLHLVLNMVDATESFKSAESWTPICLPKFDSGGFLHGHISYIDESCPACLLLLTVDKDAFFTLAECRQKIVEKLKKHNVMAAINTSLNTKFYNINEIGITDLRHFMYKFKSLSQYTSPCMKRIPYHTDQESKRLFKRYQNLHHRVHSNARPLRILLHVGENETLLGWVTSTFELYATFEPLVTKMSAISAVNKIIKWV